MTDNQIEQEIQAIIATKTSTTPRVTPDDIEANIAKELFFTAGQAARGLNLPASPSDDLLTFCVLTLRNGFTVTGESACVSAENFSAQIGRDIARQNAVAKNRQRIADANRRRVTSAETKAKISAARKRTEEMKKQAQSPLMGYALKEKLAAK